MLKLLGFRIKKQRGSTSPRLLSQSRTRVVKPNLLHMRALSLVQKTMQQQFQKTVVRQSTRKKKQEDNSTEKMFSTIGSLLRLIFKNFDVIAGYMINNNFKIQPKLFFWYFLFNLILFACVGVCADLSLAWFILCKSNITFSI